MRLENEDISIIDIDDEKIKRIKKLELINCSDKNKILNKFINLINLKIYNCEIEEIPEHLIKIEDLTIIYDEDYNKIEIKEIPKTLRNIKKINIKSKYIKIKEGEYKKLEEYNIIK